MRFASFARFSRMCSRAYPTPESDAVFSGPDTYRLVSLIQPPWTRLWPILLLERRGPATLS
jgi:hypothetical protein